MAPAYQNVNTGQVVVSDEPRPDLEGLARWVEVPEPVEADPAQSEDGQTPTTPADGDPEPPAEVVETPTEDWTHDQLDAYAREHGIDLPSTAKTKADKVAAIAAHTPAPQGE